MLKISKREGITDDPKMVIFCLFAFSFYILTLIPWHVQTSLIRLKMDFLLQYARQTWRSMFQPQVSVQSNPTEHLHLRRDTTPAICYDDCSTTPLSGYDYQAADL